VTKIASIESHGFLLGSAVAARLRVGFIASRKQAGLFPRPKLTEATTGKRSRASSAAQLCHPGDNVALVQDWFETDSQASAQALIERAGARHADARIIVDSSTSTPKTRWPRATR
jgi:adenine phosphoribosyltransferase